MYGRTVTRTLGALAVSALLALSSAPALAQPTPEQRRSDLLFQEGKALLEQGAVADACAKLAESLALVPRSGTRLNLAMCRHKEGRYATALRLYQESLDAAIADKRPDREELVRRALVEIRPLLSWLVVRAPAAAAGLAVSCDGAPIDRTSWGSPIPVDPGPHVIRAEAPGKQPFELLVTAGGPGDRRVVDLPALAPVPSIESAPSAPPSQAPRAMRIAGIATLGVGTALTGIGAVFGIQAIRDSAASKKLCPNDACPTGEGLAANQSARTSARAANVLLPVGLAAAGAGVFLLVYRPKATSAKQARDLWISPSIGGGTVGGSF